MLQYINKYFIAVNVFGVVFIAWMITCQILVIGILLILIITVAIVAVTFYHLCPVINHQYHETYAMFAASALMFLDSKYHKKICS